MVKRSILEHLHRSAFKWCAWEVDAIIFVIVFQLEREAYCAPISIPEESATKEGDVDVCDSGIEVNIGRIVGIVFDDERRHEVACSVLIISEGDSVLKGFDTGYSVGCFFVADERRRREMCNSLHSSISVGHIGIGHARNLVIATTYVIYVRRFFLTQNRIQIEIVVKHTSIVSTHNRAILGISIEFETVCQTIANHGIVGVCAGNTTHDSLLHDILAIPYLGRADTADNGTVRVGADDTT